MADEPIGRFPLWVEWSGLPAELLAKGKSPVPWLLLRMIMQFDIAQHRHRPGVVELPLGEFLARSGMNEKAFKAALRTLRKLQLVRAYIPEAEEEEALFQVLVPLRTPIAAEDVLRAHHALAKCSVEDLRYATNPGEDQALEERLKEVIDLYLDVLSMRVNSLIVDDLRVVTERYELALIRRVFARARKHEGVGLAWIMAEIRREDRHAREKPTSGDVGVG